MQSRQIRTTTRKQQIKWIKYQLPLQRREIFRANALILLLTISDKPTMRLKSIARPQASPRATASFNWVAILFGLGFLIVGLLLLSGIIRADGGPNSNSDFAVQLCMGLLFTGIGAGAIISSAVTKRRHYKLLIQKKRYPKEPWLWRDDWETRSIRNSLMEEIASIWFFAVFWNLIALPMTPHLKEATEEGQYVALIGFIFPIVGVGFVIWALYKTLQWKRSGQSIFLLETLPAVPGANLRGTVSLGTTLNPPDGFLQKLSCIRQHRDRSNRRNQRSAALAGNT